MKHFAIALSVFTLTVAALFSHKNVAAGDELIPALLSSGEQGLQNLIEFPDWRGDAEISILCGARWQPTVIFWITTAGVLTIESFITSKRLKRLLQRPERCRPG